jgi:hypothetical protein
VLVGKNGMTACAIELTGYAILAPVMAERNVSSLVVQPAAQWRTLEAMRLCCLLLLPALVTGQQAIYYNRPNGLDPLTVGMKNDQPRTKMAAQTSSSETFIQPPSINLGGEFSFSKTSAPTSLRGMQHRYGLRSTVSRSMTTTRVIRHWIGTTTATQIFSVASARAHAKVNFSFTSIKVSATRKDCPFSKQVQGLIGPRMVVT